MSGVQADAVEAIADLVRREDAGKLFPLVEGRRLGIVLSEGQRLDQVDLEGTLPFPLRKTGHPALHDAPSFVTYVDRHKTAEGSTLWAHLAPGSARVIAVLDDHETDRDRGGLVGAAGWGQHRATLHLASTPDWDLWLSHDGDLLDQEEFAEHVEQGAAVIRDPDPATMLEVAQTFHAKTGVDFKASARLDSGETQLRYEESTAARAGVTGSIAIPDIITLSLQPFENGPVYDLVARFRYRINGGKLRLGYRLIRPHDARRLAFGDIVTEIGDRTLLPVVMGVPRS